MKEKCSFVVMIGMLLSILYLSVGCTTHPSAAEVGAARGAAAGAIVGQALGRSTKSTMIGVGAGALGGAVLNNERAKNRGY